MERSRNFYKTIRLGYILISVLIGCIAYNSFYEWQEIEALELDNKKIDEFRKEINNINIQMIKFSLFGETILEWNDKDIEHYHAQRMAMDSMLCRFKATYPAERIDSVRHLLEDKERQMCQIVQILEQQQAINDKITSQVPVIVQKSVQEQPKKSKRKGFLGIFGKKEEAKPTVTTTMHRSFNRNMRTEQQAQSRRLSVHADSLAARNAELNRQLQGLVVQIDGKVQTDLQKREAEITAMRERSFIQIGGLTGFVILLLVISYIIIHRNANRIKRYKQETADLIERLQQMAKRNEALITSRKKAVHTITHELRTPLTAITGYAGLIQKNFDADKTGMYIRNIQQSSDRMREMLNTLLSFFRLDDGKEQPNFSTCRISSIAHTLESEFMPIAINKGLALTVTNHTDAVVLTDKERILQIGNNLLSNAIKFTENGAVSLTMGYDNGMLKLIVKDTGSGMTEEEQQRVFGAFERLSNAAAKDGFGLGLSIVQRIVTMLGGTIQLKSEKGKGSRFTVEIPMQSAEELPERINKTQIHHNRTLHDIVAIDNDKVLLLMLKEMYAQEGIHCDTCTDVAELMEMIRRKEYSLLLTDLNMPDINGFELLELLRTSNVGNSRIIPIIVTTASGSCNREELLERGFSDCLLKPFSISELMEVSDKCAMKGKHYYISYDNYGNPSFLHENPYSNMPFPDQGFRLLALYRFWNYIEYFSPYRNITDKNWNIVLKEYIPQFLNAKNELEYELVALRLIAVTNDTHAGSMPIGNKIAETRGKLSPPFKVQFVENQLIVYDFYNPEKQVLTDLKIGDVITHISGKSVKYIVDSIGNYYPASNTTSKLRDISFNILRSDEQYLEIQYVTNNQTKVTNLKLFPSDSLNLFPKYEEKCYKTIDDNIGYITLRSIKKEDISVIKSTLKSSKGIIIDLRNGTSEYIPYSLGSFFVSNVTPFAKIAVGNINNLGVFHFIEAPPILPDKDYYKGKLVVIVNEFTQSMGEFTAMAFRAGLNTTIIGSTTAGTDGTARQIYLPGNLKTMITGYGVFYPDGKQTQRVGIVPDIIISPTIKGIKNGKDEVLDMAIEIINNE